MKLASLFTDGCVFQRRKPICVFGEGDGRVTVEFLGAEVAADSCDGKWLVTLPAAEAGGAYEMVVRLESCAQVGGTPPCETIVLKDILIGEVFIAAGQSNMEHPVFRAVGGIDDAKSSKNDNIRLFTVPRKFIDDKPNWGWHFDGYEEVDTPWQKCDEENVLNFSAIGYYFAAYLQNELNIPVGIISCNWGATCVETFIDEASIESDDILRAFAQHFYAEADAMNQEEYERTFNDFIDRTDAYCREYAGAAFRAVREVGLEAAIVYPMGDRPVEPPGRYNRNRPSGLYNTMVQRLIPFKTAGVLWYQGENNANKHDIHYVHKYSVLLNSWRAAFGDPTLPFYAVQLAPFRANEDWGMFRELQMKAAKELPYSYLASTQAIHGDPLDIHPTRKKEVALRLFKLAMVHNYGADIECSGPIFRKATINGKTIRLEFDHTEKLISRNPLSGFEICDDDKIFVNAHAVIEGNTILVTEFSPGAIRSAVAVRYCYDNEAVGGIYNEVGLPMFPFTTE